MDLCDLGRSPCPRNLRQSMAVPCRLVSRMLASLHQTPAGIRLCLSGLGFLPCFQCSGCLAHSFTYGEWTLERPGHALADDGIGRWRLALPVGSGVPLAIVDSNPPVQGHHRHCHAAVALFLQFLRR